jgi:hypothetical protein
MRNHASTSNANGNITKSTIVKAASTFTSPKRVLLPPPVIDLQSSLPFLLNRARILSLEFHSSPRPLPRTPLLSRHLPKLFADGVQVTPDCIDLENTFCTRTNVPDARTVRALELFPPPLSLALDAKVPFPPRKGRQSNDEMCFTPAPSVERDVRMSDPPVLEREEYLILHSPTMPHELLVPDDF